MIFFSDFGSGVVDITGYGVLAYRSGTDDTDDAAAHYNSEAYDVGGWHTTGGSNENFTVPSGVDYARVIVCNRRAGASTIRDAILKGGASFAGTASLISNTPGAEAATSATAIVSVSSGNVFIVDPGGTSAGTFTDIDSWCAVEAIPSANKMALVAKGGNQTVAAATTTTMHWSSEIRDTDAFHSNIASTVTITIASPGVISWTAHGFANGTPIVLSTTGALPTGLAAGTIYYVVSTAANTFQLAATTGGAAINTSGSQSGVHTATNSSRVYAASGTSGLVRISASIKVASTVSSDQVVLSSLKNGAAAAGLFQRDVEDERNVSAVSAILAVTPGTDFFESRAFHTSGSTVNADDASWMMIEEIPAGTKYCLLEKAATQSVGSTFVALAFGAGSEVADTDGFHDTASNNTRISVLTGLGITQARFSFNVLSASTAGQLIAEVRRNGSSTPVPGLPRQETDTAGTDSVNGFGAWIDVDDGTDYFELFCYSDNTQTMPISGLTWFCAEFR